MSDTNENPKVTDIAEARAKRAELQAKPTDTEATVSYLRPYLTEIIAGLSDEEKMQKLAKNVFEDVLSQIPEGQHQAFVDALQAMVNENNPTPPAASGKVARLYKVPSVDGNWREAASA